MATIDPMQTAARVRSPRHSRDWWRHFVAAWPRSGLTQAEYCRRHGVRLGSFCWWRYRLTREASGGSTTFTPVKIVPSSASQPIASSSGVVDVLLASGHVVRAQVGCDLEFLCRVVTALEDRVC